MDAKVMHTFLILFLCRGAGGLCYRMILNPPSMTNVMDLNGNLFPGRAFSPLCILEAAGAKYQIKGPDALPAEHTCFAPPMCAFPDGAIIAQVGAICIALGQALG